MPMEQKTKISFYTFRYVSVGSPSDNSLNHTPGPKAVE